VHAVSAADVETYLQASLSEQLNNDSSQKIYSNGIDGVVLGNFRKEGDVMTVSLIATGQIGPKIDEARLKEEVRGKIYGEVQSTLQEIDGVKDVDVQFSYPWVRTVPNNIDKIQIEFQVENE
jgi:hypothetical protein